MAKQENLELDNIGAIVLVNCYNYYYGGYKSDILLNKLSPLEENFLKCSACKGLMRDACSTDSGKKLKCRPCLTEEEVGYSLAASNLTIEQLSCRCPLSKRGCAWQGVIAEVHKHLYTCQHAIVECSYVKFGCKHILMRSELDKHRGDSKEYHCEVVSVFMGTRIEQLEAENKQQSETIAELAKQVAILSNTIELERIQQKQKIEKLEREHKKTIRELESAEKKKVVLSWMVEINQIKGLLSGQVNQYPADTVRSGLYHQNMSVFNGTRSEISSSARYRKPINQLNSPQYGQNAISPGINGNAFYSPSFIIDLLYYAQSNLTFNPHEQSVVLNIQALHAETNEGMIWPLTATIIVSIIGQDKTEHYHDAKQISIKSAGYTAQIATIQYDTLRNIASDVIELKIEVERGSINNPPGYLNAQRQ